MGEHQFHFNQRNSSWSLNAQSSAEAETAVYALAARNLQFTLHLFDFLDRPQQLPIHIFTDNSATRDSIKNPGVTARTRHYVRWLLYAREQFQNSIPPSHLCPKMDLYIADDG